MDEKLLRIGTTYIPVNNIERSTEWYKNKLGAEVSYQDEDKGIINLANQSIFLVKSDEHQSSNFIDIYGEERFSITFEVDGLDALKTIHKDFIDKGVKLKTEVTLAGILSFMI